MRPITHILTSQAFTVCVVDLLPLEVSGQPAGTARDWSNYWNLGNRAQQNEIFSSRSSQSVSNDPLQIFVLCQMLYYKHQYPFFFAIPLILLHKTYLCGL